MISNPQTQNNPHRRYDSNTTTVYLPLPKSMLDVIFSDQIREKILGKTFGKIDDSVNWDFDTGIVTINKSRTFRVIAATQTNLRRINEYIKTNGTPDLIIKEIGSVGFAKTNRRIDLFCEVIGANLVLVEPFEFNVGGLNGVSEFRRRHLTDDPQYQLLGESGITGGSLRVRSVALPTAAVDLPASHPEVVAAHTLKNAAKARNDPHPFATSKWMMDSMTNNVSTGKTEFIPTPTPGDLPQITNRVVIDQNKDLHVLANSTQAQVPVLTITNDRIANTATDIVDGTIYRTTLDGYATNAFPARPSCFYYPHPPQIGLFGLTPYTLFSNPRDLAIIIGLALLSTDSNSKTYHYNYITTTTVIDNQNIEDELYGESK